MIERIPMKQGIIKVYLGGEHRLKATIGDAVYSAILGAQVVMIQFIKRQELCESSFLHKLEPEIKVFELYKSEEDFESLTDERKEEERLNILNGVNFSKKVLSTGEADIIILNDILQLVEKKMISEEDVLGILRCKSEETSIILTGRTCSPAVSSFVDEVCRID